MRIFIFNQLKFFLYQFQSFRNFQIYFIINFLLQYYIIIEDINLFLYLILIHFSEKTIKAISQLFPSFIYKILRNLLLLQLLT